MREDAAKLLRQLTQNEYCGIIKSANMHNNYARRVIIMMKWFIEMNFPTLIILVYMSAFLMINSIFSKKITIY